MKMLNIINEMKKLLAPWSQGRRVCALSLVLFTLAACSDPPDGLECVEADDWGNTENISIKVPANQEYTSAGIKVKQDEPLKIQVSGLIDICPDVITVGATGSTSATDTSHPIDASSDQWQDSGIEVVAGGKLNIVVNGSYNDRTGEQTDGKGLYVLISPTDPNQDSQVSEYHNTDLSVPSRNSKWWYGTRGITADSSQSKYDDTDKADGASVFFELYDNGTVGDEGSGFAGTSPIDGKIYFRYARTASARGLSNHGDGTARYSPWLGEYAWSEDSCNSCRQTTIAGTCAAVGFLTAGIGGVVCLATWESSCAGEGYLEEVYRSNGEKKDATESGHYCREHYKYQSLDEQPSDSAAEGNHWIDGAYDGSEADGYLRKERDGSASDTSATANSGGYDISITKGCTGTYGRYMDMDIGFGKATLVNKTEPTGCVEGTEGCTVSVDSWNGLPVKVPVYSVPGANFTSMDLRYEDGVPVNNENPPYTSEGTYGGEDSSGEITGTVPSSGELWFHIKDNATTAEHPEPYYGDNVGEYTVKVKTTKVSDGFSSIMQDLIDPIRGLVFGYCRIYDDPGTDTINEADLRYQLDKNACGSGWLPGITERMYNTLVGGTIDPSTSQLSYDSNGNAVLSGGSVSGNPFINGVRAALVLFIVIYGGLFMMGMIQEPQADFLKRVAKFAIVSALISPGSWNFFSTYMFNAFIYGVDNLIAMMSSSFSGVVSTVLMDPITGKIIEDASGQPVPLDKNLFAFADQTLTLMFSKEAFIKLSSLIFQTPIGILYFIVILIGMLIFLIGLFKALVIYLLSVLAISLLLIVSPIFMSMMLFQTTARYFDNWFKNVLNYSLQPIFVFVALSIFNMFIYSVIYSLLYFRACWSVVYSWDTIFGDIPLFYFYLPDSESGIGGVPIAMFQIFIFIILCHAMHKFIDWMAEMAAHITITNRGTSLAKAAQSGISQVVAMGKKGGGSLMKLAKGGTGGLKGALSKGISKAAKRTGIK